MPRGRVDSATYERLPAAVRAVVDEVASELAATGGYHGVARDARTDAVAIVLRTIAAVSDLLHDVLETSARPE